MGSLEIDLNSFVKLYVNTALEITDETISLRDFDNKLRDFLCSKTGLTREQIIYLHHSFHWAFFRDKECNSPLELLSQRVGEHYIVCPKGEFSFKDSSDELVGYILEKYGKYLGERWTNAIN